MAKSVVGFNCVVAGTGLQKDLKAPEEEKKKEGRKDKNPK